ncbi:ankyrin [Setomelanomma holmii]|uniref:Ankyrin n=1 Tax=Setomelanomma holmii TaxID=210430 RepID=A0A9P4HP72_9PLEO|nr:ankyrin [Setomelanomma holmii]
MATQETSRPPHEHLGYARLQNPTDASIIPFFTACETNVISSALQLASGREPGVLTFGLTRAVKAGHFELANQLVVIGAEWDAFTVNFAAKSIPGVNWLVESGYNVNTSLIGGGGLLGIVIRRNDEASIRYLLEHGARPELGPPLVAGSLQSIRPETNSYWTLNQAAAFCTPQVFALLLEHGADVNAAIPLHYAAGTGLPPSPDNLPISSRIPMLEYLVGLGIDVNAMDDAIRTEGYGCAYDGTPLSYAVKWGGVEETRWLLQHGADPDKKSIYGVSAKDQAMRLPSDHLVAVLLRET